LIGAAAVRRRIWWRAWRKKGAGAERPFSLRRGRLPHLAADCEGPPRPLKVQGRRRRHPLCADEGHAIPKASAFLFDVRAVRRQAVGIVEGVPRAEAIKPLGVGANKHAVIPYRNGIDAAEGRLLRPSGQKALMGRVFAQISSASDHRARASIHQGRRLHAQILARPRRNAQRPRPEEISSRCGKKKKAGFRRHLERFRSYRALG